MAKTHTHTVRIANGIWAADVDVPMLNEGTYSSAMGTP